MFIMHCKYKKKIAGILNIFDIIFIIFMGYYTRLILPSDFEVHAIIGIMILLSMLSLLLIWNIINGIKLALYMNVFFALLRVFLALTIIIEVPIILLFLIYDVILILYLFRVNSCFLNPSRFFAKPDVAVAFIAIGFVFAYGFFGSLLLGRGFNPKIDNPIDALYYTGEVITTLGFGDIIPTNDITKLFTISLSVLGLGAFFGATTIIIAPIVYSRGRRVVSLMDRLESLSLKDFILIIGHNNYLNNVIKELRSNDELIIIIDKDEGKREYLESLGCYFEGNMSMVEVINNFKLTRAKMILLGYNDDGVNLLNLNSILNTYGDTIKEKIIVIINNPENYLSFKNQAGLIINLSEILYENMKKYFGNA